MSVAANRNNPALQRSAMSENCPKFSKFYETDYKDQLTNYLLL